MLPKECIVIEQVSNKECAIETLGTNEIQRHYTLCVEGMQSKNVGMFESVCFKLQ